MTLPPMPPAMNPTGTAGEPAAALTVTAALSANAATGRFSHSRALETTSGVASAVRVSANVRSRAWT
jgi:hypothetical protein